MQPATSPAQPTRENFAYFDDPAFLAQASGNARELDFFLEGMNCTACVWLLEKLPELCADATMARVRLGRSQIRVRRSETGSFARIAEMLDRLGYRPHPLASESTAQQAQILQDRRDLVRIGIAGFCVGNIMLLAVSLYAGANGSLAAGFRWLSAALALPVLSYSAWPFYRSVLGALRARTINIDLPIVAALFAGTIVSIDGLLKGADRLYFDSLSMLVFLLLASRFWLKRVHRNFLDATDLERQLLTGTVLKQTATGLIPVSSAAVVRDDVLSLNEQQIIPVDGRLLSPSAVVQTAMLSGESTPRTLHQGDALEAGSQLLSPPQTLMRANGSASESRLARILKDAEQAAQNKPRLLRLSDHVGRIFVVIVALAAIACFAAFAATDPAEGMRRALALIIVTCPCVFGMAIPLSVSLAVGATARFGIIIKNPDVLERLMRCRKIVFDKTGTLTEGNLQVTAIESCDPSVEFVAPRHLSALLAVEAEQAHPIAHALRQALRLHAEQTQGAPKALTVRILSQGGIEGRVNGHMYRLLPVGIADLEQRNDQRNDQRNEKRANGEIRAVYELSCEQQPVARISLRDQLKPQARQALMDLRARDLSLELLSGDHPETVALCARELDFHPGEFAAARGPEEKVAHLRTLASHQGAVTMMVGDGANDAAALATADIGVAVRGAMDVSLKAADVYLAPHADLTALNRLMQIATLTQRAIYRNLSLSAGFNIIAGTMAAIGLMAPLWAAALMPLSSLSVLLSALYTGMKMKGLKS